MTRRRLRRLVDPALLVGTASHSFGRALADALDVQPAGLKTQRFPDGETYVRIEEEVAGRPVLAVQTTAPDTAFVELLLMLDAARESGASEVTAVVPYYGYARQDKAFQPGEAISARAAARAIATSADRLVTVDPHKEDLLDYFDGPASSVSAVDWLADELGDWGADAILAPDAGARDRARHAADRLQVPFDHLEKTRIGPEEVRMEPKDLDVAGRRVAILDDMIASGTTMMRAAQHLRDQGAEAVYAACTHGVFTHDAVPKLLDAGIDRVLCTDTLPSSGCDVVSAAPAVAQALRAVAHA